MRGPDSFAFGPRFSCLRRESCRVFSPPPFLRYTDSIMQQVQPEQNEMQTALSLVAQTPPVTVTETEQANVSAAPEMQRLINKIIQRNKRNNWHFIATILAVGVVVVGGQIISLLSLGPTSTAVILGRLALLVEFAGIGAAGRYWSRNALPLDAADIMRRGGIQAIGPLACASGFGPLPQRRAIYAALIELLPQMKASDAPMMTSAVKMAMKAALDPDRDAFTNLPLYDLQCALLKALEQVGDATFIPAVVRLTRRRARTPGQKKVRQAALECLPMLQANRGESEASRTLLRASQPKQTDPNMLLRPVSGGSETDKVELLRGTDAPGTPAP